MFFRKKIASPHVTSEGLRRVCKITDSLTTEEVRLMRDVMTNPALWPGVLAHMDYMRNR